MTVTELRRNVKSNLPHVKISIKAVSFSDLARGSANFITITGAQSHDEITTINHWAESAGIKPDTGIRFF